VRIKLLQRPPITSIDGLDLARFELGREYEVGSSLGALLLAEGWAEPVALDEPRPPAAFSEKDPFDRPPSDPDQPYNLIREHYPPYADEAGAVADDFERRLSGVRDAQTPTDPRKR
jgi:hypothetical protein